VTAALRLDTARALYAAGPSGANWSRWICWATRLAVENALAEYWTRRCPELVEASMRGQLLALRVHAGPETARRTRALWCALSQAAHHHAYDLPPAAYSARAVSRRRAAVTGRSRRRACGCRG
jgi:hypothetical protein